MTYKHSHTAAIAAFFVVYAGWRTVYYYEQHPRAVVYGLGFLAAAVILVAVFPRSRVSEALETEMTPSLEIEGLSRSECVAKALWFIGGGAFFAGAEILFYLATRESGRVTDDPFELVLLLTLNFFMLSGSGAGLYLLVRARFRPAEPDTSENDLEP